MPDPLGPKGDHRLMPVAASFSSVERRLMVVGLGLLLVIGALLAPGFGQSTDEFPTFEYAANCL